MYIPLVEQVLPPMHKVQTFHQCSTKLAWAFGNPLDIGLAVSANDLSRFAKVD